jgi:hypothetical protein
MNFCCMHTKYTFTRYAYTRVVLYFQHSKIHPIYCNDTVVHPKALITLAVVPSPTIPCKRRIFSINIAWCADGGHGTDICKRVDQTDKNDSPMMDVMTYHASTWSSHARRLNDRRSSKLESPNTVRTRWHTARQGNAHKKTWGEIFDLNYVAEGFFCLLPNIL